MSQDAFHGPSETDEAHNVQELHAPIMREQAEPRDGYEPVPMWFLIFFGGMLFFGGYYTSQYSGDFRSDVYDERFRGGAPKLAAAPEDPVVLGKRLYAGNCQQCHQPDGKGAAGQFPPLAGSDWVTGSPAKLNRILLHGLQGELTVNGAKYNGNMPAFNRLKEEQIAAVLSYIRREWGNQAEPITGPAVAATKAATAKRTAPWSESELKAITAEDAAAPAPAASPKAEAPKAEPPKKP